MDSTEYIDQNLPPPGTFGSPRGRRISSVVVPGRNPSSSNYGLEHDLTAGSAPSTATAVDSVGVEEPMEVVPPQEEAVSAAKSYAV